MKTVLITGPTSGIGLALTQIFAQKGYAIVLVARHEKMLSLLATDINARYATNVKYFGVDLSKQGSVDLLLDWLMKEHIYIDILINNAGFGNYGRLEDTDKNTDTELINLNILALTLLTKGLLPQIKKNSGRILNVGSVASFLPGPFMNTYFASKAYVLSFSIALREEVAKQGISVSCLCPGPTQTNFGKRAHYDQVLDRRHVMDVNDVANEAYHGLMKGRAIIVPGWKNKLIVWVSTFVPRTLMARLVRLASGY